MFNMHNMFIEYSLWTENKATIFYDVNMWKFPEMHTSYVTQATSVTSISELVPVL